jgi:hypothetical protein
MASSIGEVRGVPTGPRRLRDRCQRATFSTGRRADADAAGRPDIGDSATNAAVRKR